MSETLWGVIIGALAAIIGGVLAQIITYHFEKKKFIGEQKKNTYEIALGIVTQFLFSCQYPSGKFLYVKATLNDLLEATTKLSIYGSKKVHGLFFETFHCAFPEFTGNLEDIENPTGYLYIEEKNVAPFIESVKKLEKQIRKELGID